VNDGYKWTRGPHLRALFEERKQGHCIACDGELPPQKVRTRARVLCDSPDCETVYQAAYGRDRRERLAKMRGKKP